MNVKSVNVFLICGAPGAGKTSLGRALAARLGIASVSIDDLMTVAQTVTTSETHPGLHIMNKMPHVEYFTNSSVDQLQADANMQHEAAWQFIKRLIEKHATWDPSPIVIDGWHLRPSKVAELNLPNLWSGWIVISPAGVRVEPIVDVTKIVLALFTTLGFMAALFTRMKSTKPPKLNI